MPKFAFLVSFLWIISLSTFAQKTVFTHADSLHGYPNVFRTCYNVTSYDLEVRVEIDKKRIAGTNVMHFQVLNELTALQIDFAKSMDVYKITWKGKELQYQRDENAIYVIFPQALGEGTSQEISIIFSGTPTEAIKPPWDGGWVWSKDKEGKPWIALACEGEGASLWFPCKDLNTDEPDSMNVAIIIPNNELMAVSNGDMRNIELLSGNLRKFNWHISYPINLYNVTVNIGNYMYFTDKYITANGKEYPLEYYVLSGNLTQAQKHFQQVKPMLKCYEKYFGEYPFWRDGYALVETPFWGMEHQTAIAYGNEYQNNEYGFDFIIVHESGHEWFGNSITMEDKADMWIHEAFTTYAEAIYVEETQGYNKMLAYLAGQRNRIENKSLIVAPRGVAFDDWEDADMYFKGTWMLQTLRWIVNDDKLWFATIKKFCETYRLKNVNTDQTIAFFNQSLGKDYTYLFNQYLHNLDIPSFEYKIIKSKKEYQLQYRWVTKEKKFALPLTVETTLGKENLIPTTEWQSKTYLIQKGMKDLQVLPVSTDKGLFTVKKVN